MVRRGESPQQEDPETASSGLTRRAFVLAGAAAIASARAAGAQPRGPTAQQVIDRIRAAVGVPWRETTVDNFKAGDPAAVVTGVATTTMATLGVLRQASAAGRNLIISYEPTFYSGNDSPGARAADPVYLAKQAFIDEHGLVVWRFSDHWLARTPNEFTRALAAALGWTAGRDATHDSIYGIAPTTLAAVTAHVRTTLDLRGGLRVIGSPERPIRRVAVSPGTTSLATAVQTLQHADLIVSGEPREWEAVEYVFDSSFAGQPKSMIAVGRIVSEEPGMRACADWVRTLVREVPVEAIPVGDPYWRPAP